MMMMMIIIIIIIITQVLTHLFIFFSRLLSSEVFHNPRLCHGSCRPSSASDRQGSNSITV